MKRIWILLLFGAFVFMSCQKEGVDNPSAEESIWNGVDPPTSEIVDDVIYPQTKWGNSYVTEEWGLTIDWCTGGGDIIHNCLSFPVKITIESSDSPAGPVATYELPAGESVSLIIGFAGWTTSFRDPNMVLFSIDLGSYGALIATPKEENHPGWLKYFRDNYTMEETGEFFTHSVTLKNGETKEYTFWRDLENRHYPIDEKLLEFLSVTE